MSGVLSKLLGVRSGSEEMENTDDHLISTVRSVVESLGGHLDIAAVFGDE